MINPSAVRPQRAVKLKGRPPKSLQQYRRDLTQANKRIRGLERTLEQTKTLIGDLSRQVEELKRVRARAQFPLVIDALTRTEAIRNILSFILSQEHIGQTASFFICQGNLLVLREKAGQDRGLREFRHFAIDMQSVVGRAVCAGHVVRVSDCSSDASYKRYRQGPQIGALIAAPVVRAGERVGAICVHADEPNTLSASDAEHIGEIAALAALTVRYLDLVHVDPLTGALNRRGLEAEAEASRRASPRRQLALFYVDADHFKLINDEHGHEKGDEVLRGLATLLMKFAGKEGLVARLGGEEFVVIRRIDRTSVDALADQLLHEIRKQPLAGIPLRVSVGATEWSSKENLTVVQRRADSLETKAKTTRDCAEIG